MRKSLRRTGATLTLAVLALPVLAAPAYGHVTATPDEADSAYFRTALRVSHGCGDSPTTSVRVRVPEGIDSVRPEVVPGWDVELVTEGEAVEGEEGPAVTVTEIAWVGGSLPDAHFQEFGLSFRITEQAPEVIYLPTVQECEEGEHPWIEIPATLDEWGDLGEPAPYVINNLGAADGEPAGDTIEETAPAGAAQEESAADGSAGATADAAGGGLLPVLALIAGLLGLAAGLAALWLTVRARPAGAGRD